MTEHEENGTTERLLAHERLATGGLARWMRMCANNPWRVVLAWVAIIAILIFLVATIGGSLRDEFTIPGSDTQKATDLIEAEFSSEQGAVLNIVFAAPEGERLDTPARKAAIAQGDRAPEDDGVQARQGDGQGRPHERRRPVQQGHVLEGRAHRLRRGPVRPDDRGHRPAAGRGGGGRRPPDRRARRGHGRVQRRGRVPAARAGHLRGARPARGDHRAAVRLPHVRRDADPDRARDRRADDGLPAALHPRRADRHQHGHADPRLDDRARGRDRLLAVHRHPLQTATPRWPRAARCGSRGRLVGRPRGAVRRPHGRDLGVRASRSSGSTS